MNLTAWPHGPAEGGPMNSPEKRRAIVAMPARGGARSLRPLRRFTASDARLVSPVHTTRLNAVGRRPSGLTAMNAMVVRTSIGIWRL